MCFFTEEKTEKKTQLATIATITIFKKTTEKNLQRTDAMIQEQNVIIQAGFVF